MKTIAISAALLFLTAGALRAEIPEPMRALAEALPAREVAILLGVGRDYGLSGDRLKLLLAIRKIENGGPGVEMGVASDFPRHRAHRYAGDLDRSLRLQAKWAAGTIQKNYTGDLEAFAKQYCPPKWKHWSGMARRWMSKH